ncbi:MAG: hypothetical protein EXS64_03700 [Candidatus Latescibacteria bacterium]|nr:hypothetical protein [Candidatus Latescibacterota bacterium]
MKSAQQGVVAALTAVEAAVSTGTAAGEAPVPGKEAVAAVRTATVVVAAADAADHLKRGADFVCPSRDDHLVINAAIAALPETGGRVHLTGGTYSIGAVPGTFGGVTIARSNVLLTGEGSATRLLLQDGLTDINVIWIRGDLHDVSVRDLYVNGNGKKQVPWVRERSQWNGGNGIKIINPAGGRDSAGIYDPTPRNVRVSDCHIENCQLMAVMAHGTAVEVLNCYFTGDFGSHVVEILGHSGRIEGCTLRVKDGDTVGFGFSTDRSCYYHIVNNKILVEAGGRINGHPINNWPPLLPGRAITTDREFHGIISGNILINHGTTGYVRLDGYMDLVNGNIFRGVPVVIGCPNGGMGVSFEHNLLIGSSLEIRSPHRSEESRILIDGNQFFNSSVRHTDGVVVWGTNPGYPTENAGTAVIATDQTAAVVEHGLVAVPASVQVTPANSLGAATKFWVDEVTGRQFVIRVDTPPGAPTAAFHWRAVTTGTQTLGATP